MEFLKSNSLPFLGNRRMRICAALSP